MICSLFILWKPGENPGGLGRHLLEQYLRSPQNSLLQTGHVFILVRRVFSFRLLKLVTLAEQEWEQNIRPDLDFWNSLSCRDTNFLHFGLAQIFFTLLSLDLYWQSKEQYWFHPFFLASLYLPCSRRNSLPHKRTSNFTHFFNNDILTLSGRRELNSGRRTPSPA